MNSTSGLTILGLTEQRGNHWANRDDILGHHKGFLDVDVVNAQLWPWRPTTLPVCYLEPCDEVDAEYVDDNGDTFRVITSQYHRVGVLRDDNDYDMGVFGQGVVHPPYAESLIGDAQVMLGTDKLGLSAAGVTAHGARGWVEVSVPRAVVDPTTGIGFRPNLIKATSMDGTLAHTDLLTVDVLNSGTTFWPTLIGSGASAGRIFKRKHTRFSRMISTIKNASDALGLLDQVTAEFQQMLTTLSEVKLTKAQFMDLLDVMVPTEGKAGRALALAEHKREVLHELYTLDPRCSDWQGTALGVLQTFNVYEHWFANVRNTGRSERNTWRALTGKAESADKAALKALEEVLARP